MFTWKPRETTAPSLTHPSAMPRTRLRSLPRGSGVSTPPATCGAHASQGPASAYSPGQQTQRKPLGFLLPRAPRQSPLLALLPPPSVRWRAARLERGVISLARVITSACLCLPSLRRRTGSLWSQLSTWTRPPPLPC